MSENLSARVEGLAHGVLGPLVLGGPMRLVMPLGPSFAASLDGLRRIVDDDLRSRIDVARIRRARLLVPIDVLPDIGNADWALLAALNDLLQSTNHLLSGVFTRARHTRLLSSVASTLVRVGPPRSTLEAVARHTIFGRIFELIRKDTKLTWWTGKASFRGEPPPKRLMSWREFRKVNIDATSVPLTEMADSGVPVSPQGFMVGLGRLLSLSPLTDLAHIARSTPSFEWTRTTLSLVAIPAGRRLALRAMLRDDSARAVAAIESSLSRLQPDSVPHQIVSALLEESRAKPT